MNDYDREMIMTAMEITFTVLIFIIIIGGLYGLIKSARKFNLTEQELNRIMRRNEELDQEEEKAEQPIKK